MAAPTVKCARLGKELPGLDPTTPEGSQALRMALLLGGADLKKQVQEHVSAEAWAAWREHMRMVINEYRLDATSDEANAVLANALVQFLFGGGGHVGGYVPPEQG
ncbi:MAG: Fe(2+)-trafficking protein [Phycisphaerales bacterium]|nr:Fe(2+)-trafficking protein [Phycisphaerales bacterium]